MDMKATPRFDARSLLINVSLSLTSVVIALLVAEFLSRLLMPINLWPGDVALDGHTAVRVAASKLRLVPNLVYRQVSAEFDAVTTISPRGYRVPTVEGNPDIVFIGDSFTFGWGLRDDQTFVSLYCTKEHRSCANLGRPNTGTTQQLDILEEFLRSEHWHPREVKLFMFVMSGILMHGNDFYDNLIYAKGESDENAKGEAEVEVGLYAKVFDLRKVLLEHSNVARIVKFYFAPWLRARLYPEAVRESLSDALAITRDQLQRLNALSQKYGFSYEIYILHPMQDILNGTDGDTVRTVRGLLGPAVVVKDTADLFRDHTLSYYYPYDAHLNPLGDRKIADFLAAEGR